MNLTDIRNINLFLFDMDGTLYLGDQLYDFTKELLQKIRSAGKRYLFMTNNSSKSVADYVKKLARLGIEVTEDELDTLPAGAVVIWEGSQQNKHGHISISLGDGREASDAVYKQTHKSYHHNADFHVFIPTV